MREPVFTDTRQISMVVREVEATMKTCVEEYGIDPREIYDFNAATMTSAERDRQLTDSASRIAVTMVGSVKR